jgi:hypothetical protein
MKMLLGDFNARAGKEDNFISTTRNENLHEIIIYNGVRVINFDTSKNLTVKITMFTNRNIHEFTWTSSDGKTHKQIDHILKYTRWHSSILDVRSFRVTDFECGGKFTERLAVSK